MLIKAKGLTYEAYKLSGNSDNTDTKVSEHVSPESTRMNISAESLRELKKNSAANGRQVAFNAQRSLDQGRRYLYND